MEKVKKNQKASWWGWKRRVKKLAWSLTLKNKDDGIWSNHFMANRRGKSRNSDNFYFLGLQNHCGQWLQQWNSKTPAPSKESYDKPVLYLVTQSCPTLCNPMDCRPPGSTVHGILPARILEWVALLQRRDQTQVSCTSGRFFTIWATREALDSILKSRDITLPTKVHLVKAMVFPVIMYGCKSWTLKKASAKELMLLNCGIGDDSWEFPGQQGDPTSPS